MAGTQTSLSLQDKLTGPLTKMMKALDNTIKVMEKMDQSATNLDTRGLANARRSIDSASSDLARLSSAAGSAGNSADRAASQQRNFNDSVNGGLPGIGSLATKLLSVVGAYKALNAAKDFLGDMFSQGIGFHAFKQSAEVAFTTFLGDAEKAKQYMDDMYAFALKTPFAYPDLLESSRNLIAFGIEAENTFAIMQAIGDATAGGGGGNVEMQSMADIFGMIQVQGRLTMMEVNRLAKHGVNAMQILADSSGVTAAEMKKQISAGAIGAGTAITALVDGMNKANGGLMDGVKNTWVGTVDSFKSSIRNAGSAMMEKFMEPLRRTIGNVTQLVKKIPEYIGPAVAAFLPVINQLNAAFEAGRFDVFFSTMGATLVVIAYLFAAVAEGAIWVAQVVDMFWPAIVIALVLLASSYIPAVLTGLGSMVIALYNVGRAWLIGLGPVGWVILAVAILIGIVMSFGVTTEQILGFVGGLFFALGAVIWNVIANVWNVIAMFADFIYNIFIDPTYAVQKLFYDLAMFGIDNMAALAGSFDSAANLLAKVFVTGANVAIGAVNGISKAIKNITGIDLGEAKKLEVEATTSFLSDGLKNMAKNLEAPTSSKDVASTPKLALKSIPGAYQSGYSKGSNLSIPKVGAPAVGEMPNMNLGDMLDELGAGAGKSKNPTGGKLDKVGKIDDEISIADEDLKMLKDLAEIKSIQNFVTLTPQVSFGDLTIREEVDADKVVKKITTQFAEDMARSAEGVYT